MKIEFSMNLPIMAQPIDDHYETATDRRYEVDDIQMGQSNTRITLMGFGNKAFNSIHFKFYLHDREIDIYNSGLINRYGTVSLPGIRYMDNQ